MLLDLVYYGGLEFCQKTDDPLSCCHAPVAHRDSRGGRESCGGERKADREVKEQVARGPVATADGSEEVDRRPSDPPLSDSRIEEGRGEPTPASVEDGGVGSREECDQSPAVAEESNRATEMSPYLELSWEAVGDDSSSELDGDEVAAPYVRLTWKASGEGAEGGEDGSMAGEGDAAPLANLGGKTESEQGRGSGAAATEDSSSAQEQSVVNEPQKQEKLEPSPSENQEASVCKDGLELPQVVVLVHEEEEQSEAKEQLVTKLPKKQIAVKHHDSPKRLSLDQANRITARDYLPFFHPQAEAVVEEDSIAQFPYSSYVISNTVESRLSCSLELTAELELQCMARKVYESVLWSISCSRPHSVCEPPKECKHALSCFGESSTPFHQSLTCMMLSQSIEHILEQISCENTASLMALLELWVRLNCLGFVTNRGPVTEMRPLGAKYSDENAHFHIWLVISWRALNLLFDRILDAAVIDSRLSNLVFSLLTLVLKGLQSVSSSSPFRTKSQTFTAVLVKLLSQESNSSDLDTTASAQHAEIGDFLKLFIMNVSISFTDTEDDVLGLHILLQVLVELLE